MRLCWNKVDTTLYQRCSTLSRRSFDVAQLWKSDVGFCFIFNVGSTLFQRWSKTLEQQWSDVEMLAGSVDGYSLHFPFSIKLFVNYKDFSWKIQISIGINWGKFVEYENLNRKTIFITWIWLNAVTFVETKEEL